MGDDVRLVTGLAPADRTAVQDLLAALVAGGAALGWTAPPTRAEVTALLDAVLAGVGSGDAACALARSAGVVVGLGYWRRYDRPTHRVHADLEKLAVAPAAQGRGIGRCLTRYLIDAARAAGIEQLTLDLRGDNLPALALYRSLGFVEYGRLRDFVAVGARRHDKVLCVLDPRADRPGPTGQSGAAAAG